jgi:hypothetical protein
MKVLENSLTDFYEIWGKDKKGKAIPVTGPGGP